MGQDKYICRSSAGPGSQCSRNSWHFCNRSKIYRVLALNDPFCSNHRRSHQKWIKSIAGSPLSPLNHFWCKTFKWRSTCCKMTLFALMLDVCGFSSSFPCFMLIWYFNYFSLDLQSSPLIFRVTSPFLPFPYDAVIEFRTVPVEGSGIGRSQAYLVL